MLAPRSFCVSAAIEEEVAGAPALSFRVTASCSRLQLQRSSRRRVLPIGVPATAVLCVSKPSRWLESPLLLAFRVWELYLMRRNPQERCFVRRRQSIDVQPAWVLDAPVSELDCPWGTGPQHKRRSCKFCTVLGWTLKVALKSP